LVQSAREFYKLILVLKSIGFVENKLDLCLLSNWNEKEVILIGIYVDDCLVIRNKERIQWLIDDLKRSSFNLKFENNLKHYLSFHNILEKKLNQIMIPQTHFINYL
jgi:hypothetical protein